MEKITDLQTYRHARASSLNPKTPSETSMLRAAKASRTSKNLSDAILPRSFQLLTAGEVTPSKDAAAAVPPSALMTSSTVSSIPPDTSQFVKKSSPNQLHTLGIVTGRELWPNMAMSRRPEAIVDRLERTIKALDQTPAELCRTVGWGQSRLANYLSGDRRITVDAVNQLEDAYHVPLLAWIYNGDPSALPSWLSAKVRKPSAA